MEHIYSTLRWRNYTRPAAIARDAGRCTVSRLLGGDCSPGPLHAHHILAIADGGEPYDVDNVGTTCAAHHPMWEALRRQLVRHMTPAPPPRCPHVHRSAEARRICEARLERQHARAVAA